MAECPVLGVSTFARSCRRVRAWQLVKIVVHLAMQSFMNLFQPRNLIFCSRACFLQLDHFLRPFSSAIRDFSAPLSMKGAGEKTEGGVCANALPPPRTTAMAKTASALSGFTVPHNRRAAYIQFPLPVLFESLLSWLQSRLGLRRRMRQLDLGPTRSCNLGVE
jgi:hypothetical protein